MLGRDVMRTFFITLAAMLALVATPAQANAPIEVVQEAVDLLTEGLDERRDELAEDKVALREFIDGILLPRFDREFAAGAVLGKYWRTASDEQKAPRLLYQENNVILRAIRDYLVESHDFPSQRLEVRAWLTEIETNATAARSVDARLLLPKEQ